MEPSSRAARGYALFETALGGCGIAWGERGIVRIQLPEADQMRTARRLAAGGAVVEASPPPWVAHAIQAMIRHLQGTLQDFSGVPVDMTRVAPLPRRVYEAARAIEAGRTTTYGALATAIGPPADARAVGQALGANPFALVVPCHRVVAAGGRIGGFSAHGGAVTKARLLAIEGLPMRASQLSLDLTGTAPGGRASSRPGRR
jgi:methylated-DNA-[protein]-cysteine S-methyltransferase